MMAFDKSLSEQPASTTNIHTHTIKPFWHLSHLSSHLSRRCGPGKAGNQTTSAHHFCDGYRRAQLWPARFQPGLKSVSTLPPCPPLRCLLDPASSYQISRRLVDQSCAQQQNSHRHGSQQQQLLPILDCRKATSHITARMQ